LFSIASHGAICLAAWICAGTPLGPTEALAADDLGLLPTFAVEAAKPLRPTRVPITLSLTARDAASVSVAPDGSQILVHNQQRGSRLIGIPKTERIRLAASYLRAVAFAPQSAHVAVLDEDARLWIIALPTGTVVASYDGPFDALAFVSPQTLLVAKSCQLWRLSLADPGALTPLLAIPCGPIHLSQSGRTWLVAEPREPMQPRAGARNLYRVGLEPLTVELIAVAGASPLFDARLVGDNYACFRTLNPTAQSMGLGCVDLPHREPLHPLDRVGLLLADDNDARLLVAEEGNPAARLLTLIDLHKQVVTPLVVTHLDRWQFLPGGRRLVGASNQGGAELLDLQRNLQLPLVADTTAVFELSPIPGTDLRLYGVLRKNASTDLVELSGLPN